MVAIELKDVNKYYKVNQVDQGIRGALRGIIHPQKKIVHAVKNVSFTVEENEIVGLIGYNGAGKTSILKMISGIMYPSSGEISVLGYKPYERLNEFKKNITFIMGNKNQIWWDLPASESFELTRKIYNVEYKQYKKSIDYLVDLFEVKDILKVQVRNLSLGQRMKCEIINSLIHLPKIVFMDEPTLGLDIASQKKIRSFIKQYVSEMNATAIITSHYMQDITEMANRIIIMNKGEKVVDEGLNTFLEKNQKYKKITMVSNKCDLNIPSTWEQMLVERGEYKVVYRMANDLLNMFLKDISNFSNDVENLVIEETSVEEIVEQYLGRKSML